MDTDQAEQIAMAHPGATLEQPFGPGVDVGKVGGWIFVLLAPDGDPQSLSVKCDPDLALELRAQYPAVGPGYHLNKRHWNTVLLDGSVPDDEVAEMIGHSYGLVVAGLPAAARRVVTGA